MKAVFLWLAAFLCCGRAFAQPSVMIDDLTSSEIEAAVAAGKTTLILYCGGFHENVYSRTVNEINGPTRDHTVVAKHNIIADYLARRVAKDLGNALALSAIPYTPNGSAIGQTGREFTGELGPTPGHMAFAGTISVTDETFARLLDDIASSAIMNMGFKNVAILSDNGGGQLDRPVLQKAVEAIARKWTSKGVGVFYFDVYQRAKVECGKTIAKLDLPKEFRAKSDQFDPSPLSGCIVPIDDAAEELALDKEGKWVRKHNLTVPPFGARLVTTELGHILLEQKVAIAVDIITKRIPRVGR